MLFSIHNLPANTRFQDVKTLLKTKCGITELILDNLLPEGAGKKVTVGLAIEDDAAMLMREIDGLYLFGNRVYVEDLGKKLNSFRGHGQQPMYPPIVSETTHSNYHHEQVGLSSGGGQWQPIQNVGNVWDNKHATGGNRDFGSRLEDQRGRERSFGWDSNSGRVQGNAYSDPKFGRDSGQWNCYDSEIPFSECGKPCNRFKHYNQNDQFAQNDFGSNQFRDLHGGFDQSFNRQNCDLPQKFSPWDFDDNRKISNNFVGNRDTRINAYQGQVRPKLGGFNGPLRLPLGFHEYHSESNYNGRGHWTPAFAHQGPKANKPTYQKTFSQNKNTTLDTRTQANINMVIGKLARELLNKVDHDVNATWLTREIKKRLRERVQGIYSSELLTPNDILAEYRKKYRKIQDKALFDEVLERYNKEAAEKKNYRVKKTATAAVNPKYEGAQNNDKYDAENTTTQSLQVYRETEENTEMRKNVSDEDACWIQFGNINEKDLEEY